MFAATPLTILRPKEGSDLPSQGWHHSLAPPLSTNGTSLHCLAEVVVFALECRGVDGDGNAADDDLRNADPLE